MPMEVFSDHMLCASPALGTFPNTNSRRPRNVSLKLLLVLQIGHGGPERRGGMPLSP